MWPNLEARAEISVLLLCVVRFLMIQMLELMARKIAPRFPDL